MHSQHCCSSGLISILVIPPRLPVRLSLAYSLTNRACDPDTAPVEIAVVAELRAARRQQVEQAPSGGGWLAADADQWRAAAARTTKRSHAVSGIVGAKFFRGLDRHAHGLQQCHH